MRLASFSYLTFSTGRLSQAAAFLSPSRVFLPLEFPLSPSRLFLFLLPASLLLLSMGFELSMLHILLALSFSPALLCFSLAFLDFLLLSLDLNHLRLGGCVTHLSRSFRQTRVCHEVGSLRGLSCILFRDDAPLLCSPILSCGSPLPPCGTPRVLIGPFVRGPGPHTHLTHCAYSGGPLAGQ